MIRVVVIALVAAVTVAGCGRHATPSAHQPRQLTNLHDIGQLRAAFNKESNEPRLVVLVSPT